MMTPEQRQAVVEEAKTWLRTPYHHHADVKGHGVDCAMILSRVYSNTGIVPFIDPRPYPTDWMLHRDEERYLQQMLPYAEEVFTAPQPSSTLLAKVISGRRCFGSSSGSGLKTISLFELVKSIILRASSSIENSTGFPILMGPVNSSGVFIHRIIASNKSST
jgi:hypothetical protein